MPCTSASPSMSPFLPPSRSRPATRQAAVLAARDSEGAAPARSGAEARDGRHAPAVAPLAIAALVLTAALAMPAPIAAAAERAEAGSSRADGGTSAAGGASRPSPERRTLADELFTEAEREAWRQKIAAAPDEAQKRQLRGQRLAELQRRSREAKAAAGAGKSPSSPAREVR